MYKVRLANHSGAGADEQVGHPCDDATAEIPGLSCRDKTHLQLVILGLDHGCIIAGQQGTSACRGIARHARTQPQGALVLRRARRCAQRT